MGVASRSTVRSLAAALLAMVPREPAIRSYRSVLLKSPERFQNPLLLLQELTFPRNQPGSIGLRLGEMGGDFRQALDEFSAGRGGSLLLASLHQRDPVEPQAADGLAADLRQRKQATICQLEEMSGERLVARIPDPDCLRTRRPVIRLVQVAPEAGIDHVCRRRATA